MKRSQKIRITVHRTRMLRLVGSVTVHAVSEVTLRVGHAAARGTISLRGEDLGDGPDFAAWVLSPELEAALAPLYERDEDLGCEVSGAIADAAREAC